MAGARYSLPAFCSHGNGTHVCPSLRSLFHDSPAHVTCLVLARGPSVTPSLVQARGGSGCTREGAAPSSHAEGASWQAIFRKLGFSLGWQGIIPANADKMARKSVKLMTTKVCETACFVFHENARARRFKPESHPEFKTSSFDALLNLAFLCASSSRFRKCSTALSPTASRSASRSRSA